MAYFKPALKNSSQREMLKRVTQVSAETRGIWSKAHLAMQEAEDIRRNVQVQIQELSADLQFRTRYRDAMLSKILHAAIVATNSGMGNIQLLDPKTGRLVIQVYEGFAAPFLEYFCSVEPGHAACGTAMESHSRVIVQDVTDSPVFAKRESLEVLLDAGVRAVQSTPLFGTQGQLLGVLSTHYATPSLPNPVDLRAIDYFARWAAALIEWHDNGGFPDGLVPGGNFPRAS